MSDPRHTRNSPHDGVSGRPSANVSVREDQTPAMNRTIEPLLERLTSAVLLLDRALRVTYLSHQSDPLLAQTREALLGKTLWEVFPEAVASPFLRVYQDVLTASFAVHREAYYSPLHKWFEIVKDAAGQLIGASTITRDITERKELERQLRLSEQRLSALTEQSADAIMQVDMQPSSMSALLSGAYWDTPRKSCWGAMPLNWSTPTIGKA